MAMDIVYYNFGFSHAIESHFLRSSPYVSRTWFSNTRKKRENESKFHSELNQQSNVRTNL